MEEEVRSYQDQVFASSPFHLTEDGLLVGSRERDINGNGDGGDGGDSGISHTLRIKVQTNTVAIKDRGNHQFDT